MLSFVARESYGAQHSPSAHAIKAHAETGELKLKARVHLMLKAIVNSSSDEASS